MLNKIKEKESPIPFLLGVLASLFAFTVTIIRGIEHLGIDDAKGYVDQAHGMIHGWSFMLANPNSFEHGLGFSFAIALTFLLTNGTSLLLFKVILAIGHGLSTYLVARIGLGMELRKILWISGALIFALDPFIFIAATDIQTESLTTLIVLYWAFLYLFPIANTWKGKLHIFFFPLSGFFSVAIRPNSILPFLFIAVLIYFKWFHEKVKLLFLGLSTSLFLGLIVLFEVFITRLYSGFVFLSPVGGGNAEFMCRTEFIPQYLGMVSRAENTRINEIATGSTTASDILASHPNMSTSALNHALTNIGISTCLDHPLQSAWVMFIKTFALWRPFTVFGAYSPKIFLVSLILWLPLTVIAIWFVLQRDLSRVNRRLRNYFVVLAIGFTISLLLTPTQIRHRIAFAEPFYWLFFMYFVGSHLTRRRSIKSLESNDSLLPK